jgi:hypothetical protein
VFGASEPCDRVSAAFVGFAAFGSQIRSQHTARQLLAELFLREHLDGQSSVSRGSFGMVHGDLGCTRQTSRICIGCRIWSPQSAAPSWSSGFVWFAVGLEIRHARFRRLAHWTGLSYGDDADEFLKSGEVIGVSGVEMELIGMCGRGDQQVGESASWCRSFADDGGNDESVAPYCGSVEPDRFQR